MIRLAVMPADFISAPRQHCGHKAFNLSPSEQNSNSSQIGRHTSIQHIMKSVSIFAGLLSSLLTSTVAQSGGASAPFYLLIDQPNTKHDNLSFLACSAGGTYHALCPNYGDPSVQKDTPVLHLNATGSDPNTGILTLDRYYEDVNYTGRCP